MKRLLAYLFIVLGLGLMVNVNSAYSKMPEGFCITSWGSGSEFSFTLAPIKKYKKWMCTNIGYIDKKKYPKQYQELNNYYFPKYESYKSVKVEGSKLFSLIQGTELYIEFKDEPTLFPIVKVEPSQTQDNIDFDDNIYAKNLIAPNSTLYFFDTSSEGFSYRRVYPKFSTQFIKNGKLINDYTFYKSEKLFKHNLSNTPSYAHIRISKKLNLKLINTYKGSRNRVFEDNKKNIFNELLDEYIEDTKQFSLRNELVAYFNNIENDTLIAKAEPSQTQEVVEKKIPDKINNYKNFCHYKICMYDNISKHYARLEKEKNFKTNKDDKGHNYIYFSDKYGHYISIGIVNELVVAINIYEVTQRKIDIQNCKQVRKNYLSKYKSLYPKEKFIQEYYFGQVSNYYHYQDALFFDYMTRGLKTRFEITCSYAYKQNQNLYVTNLFVSSTNHSNLMHHYEKTKVKYIEEFTLKDFNKKKYIEIIKEKNIDLAKKTADEQKLREEKRKAEKKKKEKLRKRKAEKKKAEEKRKAEKKKKEKGIVIGALDENLLAASSGTGFFVSKSGHVITNHHVINGCERVKVSFKGNQIVSKTLAVDKSNDLAILKVDINPTHIYSVSNEDAALLEDIIIAGYPLGKQVSSSIKTSKGSITSLSGYGDNFSEFQTDAALNKGNSGGPIINEKGNVIGVAVAAFGKEKGIEGFNFGIKISTLKTFAKSSGLKLLKPSKFGFGLSNDELGELITNATVYLECHMTLAQIKKMTVDGENRKAFFRKYK